MTTYLILPYSVLTIHFRILFGRLWEIKRSLKFFLNPITDVTLPSKSSSFIDGECKNMILPDRSKTAAPVSSQLVSIPRITFLRSLISDLSFSILVNDTQRFIFALSEKKINSHFKLHITEVGITNRNVYSFILRINALLNIKCQDGEIFETLNSIQFLKTKILFFSS